MTKKDPKPGRFASDQPFHQATQHPQLIIAVAFVFLLSLLMAGGLLSYRTTTAMTQASLQVDRTYQTIAALDQVLLDLIGAENARRAYTLARQEELLQPFHTGIAQLQRDLDLVKQFTSGSPVQQQRLTRLQPLLDQRVALLRHAVDATRATPDDPALQVSLTMQGAQLMAQIRPVVAEMQQEERGRLAERTEAQKATAERTSRTILISHCLLLLFIFAICGLYFRAAGDFSRATQIGEAAEALSWKGYAAAILGTAFAAFLRWGLGKMVGPTLPPFITFYPLIMFTALLGGLGPGLLATILSVLIVDVMFIPPIGSLVISHPADQVGMALFAGINIAVTLVGSALRSARSHAVEEARRAGISERRVRATFEQAAVGIVELDKEDRIVAVNERARQTFGYPRDELLGKSIHELTHPGERQISRELNRDIQQGVRERVDYEKRYLKADGSPFWAHVAVSPLRDHEGRIIGSIGTFEDISERKRAEDAVRRSEEHLRVALGAGRMGTWSLDLATNTVFTDPLHRSLWDLDPEDTQVPAERILERIHPDDRHIWFSAIQLSEAPRPLDLQFRVVRRDGEVRWLRGSGTPQRDAAGVVRRIIGVNFDITEQKLAEEALRKSEERYRTLFESIDEGFCIVEILFNEKNQPVDFRYVQTNPAFARHTGNEAALNRSVRQTTPEIEQHWIDLFADVARKNEPVHYQRFFAPLQRWFEGFAFPLGAADQHQVGVLFSDITARKQAEDMLHRRNQHLKTLHQAAAELLLGRTPVDLLTRLQERIATTFGAEIFMLFERNSHQGHFELKACGGLSDEEKKKIRALRLGRAICAKSVEAHQPIIAVHLQTADAPNRRFLRKLGFRSYLYFPFVVNGRLQGTLSFASRRHETYDSSEIDFFHAIAGTLGEAMERRRLESELQHHASNLERQVEERTARLRETIAELEGLSYSLVHDMRAPLRAMLSYADILTKESGPRLSSEEVTLLRRIRIAARRMDGLITDSLNYSRVLLDELPIGPVHLGELLLGMVDTYPNIRPPQADVSIEVGDLVVLGNHAALTQVFSNLLGNAVKFVAPGVHPRVRVWVDAAPATLNGQPVTTVCVEDNGIGIPAEAHQKIFGMFERMHRADEYAGTGIGLALVRKSLERLGGRIRVESQPGQGSRFLVQIPLPTGSLAPASA